MNNIPPKYSIANGFDIGNLPESLSDLTQPELWLVSLVTFSPPITILKGGKHKKLMKHVTFFDSNPFEVIEKIDKITKNKETFLVVFTSPCTKKEEKLIQKQYQVRKSKIESLMEHFCENHESYKKDRLTKESFENLNSLSILRNTSLENITSFHFVGNDKSSDVISGDEHENVAETEKN